MALMSLLYATTLLVASGTVCAQSNSTSMWCIRRVTQIPSARLVDVAGLTDLPVDNTAIRCSPPGVRRGLKYSSWGI